MVPLLGAMVRCHGQVPLLDAMVGAIDGCHLVGIAGCRVVGCHCNRRGVVMTHFGRLDVVPLLDAMVWCHCWVPW